LQAEAGAFGLGLANVLFYAGAVVFPNATIGRKVRGGKKLKPHAVGFAHVEIIFCLFNIVFIKFILRCQ
jgi:hypothetical protein